MTFALQARGIRKSFGGVEVLHGVDLDAAGGSVLALLGENGAGKSTLVKIIAGDYHPDGGEIDVGGDVHTALTPVSARHLGIRMIFQALSDATATSSSSARWPTSTGASSCRRWSAGRSTTSSARRHRRGRSARRRCSASSAYRARDRSPTSTSTFAPARSWRCTARWAPEPAR